MKKIAIFGVISLAFLCAACGGGSSGSSGGGGTTEVPINNSNLNGTCAFSLMASATPGAIVPNANSTVLAGVWIFDGKGNISGEAAANGPSSNGRFRTLTGTYTLSKYGTGTIDVNQGGQSYSLSFSVNEFLDELSVIGVSGSSAVIGDCNL